MTSRKKSALTPNPKYPVSRIKLSYMHKCNMAERPQITCSKDAYEIAMDVWDPEEIDFVEEAKVIYMSRDNRVKSVYEHSKGGRHGTILEAAPIVYGALEQNASGLIVIHNHPSHCTKQSRADEECAVEIYNAAKFFKINMLDMMIITPHSFRSFADDGLRPF